MLLDGPPISSSEKELTRKERSTLAQLRSGYCRILGSYKSRIKKDASLNVCAECSTNPHDVKHLFVCPAHPTTMIPSDLWSRPTDAVRKLNYLEANNNNKSNEVTVDGFKIEELDFIINSIIIITKYCVCKHRLLCTQVGPNSSILSHL